MAVLVQKYALGKSDQIESGACFILSNFSTLRSIATERLVPMKSFVNLPYSATVGATFGHFVAKTLSLGDGRENRNATKDCFPAWRRAPSGKAAAKGRTKWGIEGQVD
jgi:hypothetical protein